MKEFFEKNKVVIVGMLTAILLTLNELFVQGQSDTKALVFAAFIAGLSWAANNLRGQWASISGIIATSLTMYLTQAESGHVSWAQIIAQAFIALLAVIAPPPKSRGYEHTDVIEEAKAEGEALVAARK